MNPPDQILGNHPFFQGIAPHYRVDISQYAAEAHFDVDDYILREGEAADKFYLIRRGRVVLSTHIPQHHFATIQTLGKNDVLGWSWFVPPYKWHFSARAVQPTEVVVINGHKLRQKCEKDCAFGYELSKRLAQVIGQRLRETRMRLR